MCPSTVANMRQKFIAQESILTHAPTVGGVNYTYSTVLDESDAYLSNSLGRSFSPIQSTQLS